MTTRLVIQGAHPEEEPARILHSGDAVSYREVFGRGGTRQERALVVQDEEVRTVLYRFATPEEPNVPLSQGDRKRAKSRDSLREEGASETVFVCGIKPGERITLTIIHE